MSLMMGLIGGAGAGASQLADQNTKLWGEQALEQQRQEAVTAREQSMARLKQSLQIEGENTQRTAMVGRIDDAAGKIADTQLAGKRALINSGVTDPSAWTPEQQAAVDQSIALDKQALIGDPKTRRQAAELTGDISPEKAAGMGNTAEMTQMKMDSLLARAEDRNQTMQQIAQIRADATTAAAQLRVDAANQRATSGKIDTATGRMLITSEDVNIKAATSQIGTLNRELVALGENVQGPDGKRVPNPARAAVKEQMDGLRADIKASQANKTAYLKSMGLMSDGGEVAPKVEAEPDVTPGTFVNLPDARKGIAGIKDPQERANAQASLEQQLAAGGGKLPQAGATAKAATTQVTELPAGSRQIGTSGGKPVYETPDGKRFIGS